MDRDQQRWKRVARTQGIRDRIAEWAARESPDELREGIQLWIGHGDASEELAMQGVAFALVVPLHDDHPTLIERYRQAAGDLPRADRVVFEAWRDTWLSVGEILELQPGRGFHLQDVVSDSVFEIREASASRQLEVGDWLATLLMPIDGRIELEGTTLPLRAATRIAAVQAYLSGMEKHELEVDDLRSGATKALMRSVVAAVRQEQRTPNLLNHDGDPIELVDVTLDIEFANVQATADEWEDAVVTDEAVTIIGRHIDALAGPVIIGTFHGDASGRATLITNSRARLDRVLSLWETRKGARLAVIERRKHPVKSDPEGPQIFMDTSHGQAESIEVGEAEYRATLASNWLDAPIPVLGGVTPREAASAGRMPELRALLPTMLGQDALTHIRKELGMPS